MFSGFQVSAVDVVEAIAEEMNRNRRVHKQGDRIEWSTVKQYMADKHEVPSEDLCVRLPHAMGPFITGEATAAGHKGLSVIRCLA